MTEKELFGLGLPYEVYYVAAARVLGDIPKPQKAMADRMFFDIGDANVEANSWERCYEGSAFCVVKALIVPLEIVKERP